MASIRRKLIDNINDSKNTRMDIAGAGMFAGWKPDELGHISRYCKIAQHIMDEAKRLGRPLDCFEMGCGHIWPLRVIYKAHLCVKEEQVRQYIGYDIDPSVLRDLWQDHINIHDTTWFKHFNGKVIVKDITVDPTFEPSSRSDGMFDVFYSTEVIEHMKPEFVEPWITAAAARLRPGGLVYISTPNHDGSNSVLPKDHVYEWRYQELHDLLTKYFQLVRVDGIFTQMPKFNRAQRENPDRCPDQLVELIQNRFDPHWQRVVLGMFYPEVANNCAWTLRKA